jgi:hypothetical protein
VDRANRMVVHPRRGPWDRRASRSGVVVG